MKLRTDTRYTTTEGKLTQAGYEALQGQLDDLATADGTLGARIMTLEGYARRVPLATKTASASASLNFTEFNNAVYSRYLFVLENVKPATNAVTLQARVSTNGGVSYDSGAGAYAHVGWAYAAGGTANFGSAAATFIQMSNATDVGNGAGAFGFTGEATLFNAADSTVHSRLMFSGSYDNAGTVGVVGNGRRLATQDTDALQFLFSSGNIASGTIRMYGLT